jgi:hypothetical protein
MGSGNVIDIAMNAVGHAVDRNCQQGKWGQIYFSGNGDTSIFLPSADVALEHFAATRGPRCVRVHRTSGEIDLSPFFSVFLGQKKTGPKAGKSGLPPLFGRADVRVSPVETRLARLPARA